MYVKGYYTPRLSRLTRSSGSFPGGRAKKQRKEFCFPNHQYMEVSYPLFKIQRTETDYGEILWLDFECVTLFFWRNRGLTKIAEEESVEMTFSIDAAELGGCRICMFF